MLLFDNALISGRSQHSSRASGRLATPRRRPSQMSIVIYVSDLDFPAFDWSAPWEKLFAIASSETVWIGYSSGELRVVAYDEEKRDRFVVAAMDVLIDELGYHPDDIAEPHYYSQCLVLPEGAPPPGLPPPPGLARGGGSPTARGSASPHVGGVSPSRGGASSLLKIAVHDVHRDPSQMLLVPTEAVRARVLADLIGGKEMVEMSRLSLASNIHYDGKSAWIGLQIWEVSIRWRSVLGMKVVGAPTGVHPGPTGRKLAEAVWVKHFLACSRGVFESRSTFLTQFCGSETVVFDHKI